MLLSLADCVVAVVAEPIDVGVIAPSVNVMAGVVVGFATDPDTPLAVVTETVVTVPVALLEPPVLGLGSGA